MTLNNVGEQKILVLMVGLPRSGKSTIAKYVSNQMGYPIVNPDAVRLAVYGKRFWAGGESLVWAIVKIMVKSLFEAGHNKVILDSTNLTVARRNEWKALYPETRFIVMDTDKQVCIDRAVKDEMPDLEAVIIRFADEIEPLNAEEKPYDITDMFIKDNIDCL